MNPRIVAVSGGVLLAAFGIFATAPQSKSKADPIEAARLNNLGAAYMNQQLFEKGLKSFQQAAELDPKLKITWLNEGIAYLNLQKIDEARVALEEAAQQDPHSPQAWYNLGLLAKNTGDAQAAIGDFQHVTEIDANDADTWYFLGASYAQARQFPQAIDAFQQALKLNPFHASAEFGLSRAYQQSGHIDEARENLKKFQDITQKKLGVPISLAYGEQGQYSRAVESPQAALKPPPQIKVRFVDVTQEAGISGIPRVPTGQQDTFLITKILSPGACFLDYGGGGKLDIFLASNGPEGGLALYRNLGGGRFEDVTRKVGLDAAMAAIGCTAGDFDNDGATDLAVTVPGKVKLLHNEKNGTFKDVAETAQISGDINNLSPVFIDYDHDGDLDLYVTRLSKRVETITCGVDSYEVPCGAGALMSVASETNEMFRNNGDGTFSNVTKLTALAGSGGVGAVGTDYDNDRAVDLVVTGWDTPGVFRNPREGDFKLLHPWSSAMPKAPNGVAVLDFDHDGWMDFAFTHYSSPGLTLWRNNHGKSFEQVKLPETNWVRAFGVAAFDYDNDGWVDLVAVGETREGKGEIKLFRNLGPDGFKDVTADVGLDKIHLEHPRAIITGDYDNDGAVDLLITQNHGPAVLLKNEGGNQNHWLRLALKGVADNKSAIGTKVEVFSGGNRQKFEIYGSNGYLGQNSPYLTVGLGDAKQADVVRLLWPTGVLQDEIDVAGDKQQDITEIDRRGSSCPTLFVWNGKRYQFVADMLGAGVVGHWVGPGQRDIPRPLEWIKVDRDMIREKQNSHFSQNQVEVGHPRSKMDCHPERSEGYMHSSAACTEPSPQKAAAQDDKLTKETVLSFRFMEPLEEAVYLDQVKLLAVDHPKDLDVYPNEYFASNPPYPKFKVVVSNNKDAKPPAAAWDDHGHNVLPDLLAHRYLGDFALTQFLGFAQPHTLTLNLGEPYRGGPLWLLMRGEVEYFSANSMYAASQAGVLAIPPYVEALGANGKWMRVIDDMGFPAGGPRTMTADLTGKLPNGAQEIRLTTNLQIYWNSILIDRTQQLIGQDDAPSSTAASSREIPRRAGENVRLRDDTAPKDSDIPSIRINSIRLIRADLEFHGYPYKIEGTPPGNVNYVYEQASATGPYTRPAGSYTRYGDVLPLLTALDDKLAVFGSGDEVQLDFDPDTLPTLPNGWVRDYFFAAYGYEKDMDFYAADGDFVAPLPFLSMEDYPYAPKQSFPLDDAHVNYLLEYNTRHMSGNEQRGYSFDYPDK